jgi:hypothetical protein
MRYKLELKWGFVFMASMLIWMTFERLVGLHSTHIDQHPTYTNLFSIVAILVYVFALRDIRNKRFDGSMTWKQGFLRGVMISIIVMLLSPLGQLITHYVISPEYFSNVIKYSVESGLQIRVEAEEYFNLKNYIVQSTIGAPLMGIVTSAIVAFFLKSKSEG